MTRKTYNTRRKNTGFGLVELMIALGIGLVVVAVAVSVGASVRADSNASKLQTQVLQISSQATALANGGSYDGMTMATLIRGEKLPSGWVVGEGESQVVRNPFGGEIVMRESSGVLEILTTQVPSGICTTVVNNLSSNFPQIAVGSTVIESGNQNIDTISTACEALANDELIFRSGVATAQA